MKSISCFLIVTTILIHSVSLTVAQDGVATVPDQSVRPGINDRFRDENLSVDEFVKQFEIESREVYAKRAEVLKTLNLKAGDRVIDLGAGTGFYTFLFANAVGKSGEVLALDIAPRFVNSIADRAKKRGLFNVVAKQSTDFGFDAKKDSYDIIFICDVYHHFEFPRQMNRAIASALRKSGRLVVIDFKREEGVSRPWVLDHVRAGQDVVREEIEASGLKFQSSNTDLLSENYIMTFQKN